MTIVYGVPPVNSVTNRILSLPHKSIAGLTPVPGNNSDNSYFGVVTGRDRVIAGLHTLFNTGGGERLMMPEFGLELESYLFEPLDSVIVGEIKDSIMGQIITFFGEEIEVVSLDVGLTENTKYRGIPGVYIKLRAKMIDTQESLTVNTEI